MRALLPKIFLAGLVCGCETLPQEHLYRDVTGQRRNDVTLNLDKGACDYEIASMNVFVATGPDVHDACMRARGWQYVGSR